MSFTGKKYILSFFLCLFVLCSNAQVKSNTESQSAIKFTENKNQWDKKVVYRAQLDGGVLFLEKNAFTYNFYDKETLRNNHMGKNNKPSGSPVRSHAFRMTFLNALKTVETSSTQTTSDYCNFYLGKDKKKWVGGAKNYREVNYKNLYTGIN